MKSFWFLALVAAATAQVQVSVVQVGNANGTLAFSPSSIQAEVGSFVQFQFLSANHSVVSSNFDAPCVPATTGTKFFSGFQPVAADSTALPTFTVQINDTAPIWLYCSQGKHCQEGMVAVINESNLIGYPFGLCGKSCLSAGEPFSGTEPLSRTEPQRELRNTSPSSSASSQSSSSTISNSSPTTSKASEPPSSPTSSSTSTRSTPSTGSTTSASSAASTSTTASTTADKKNGGISTGTAIGIGVGVTIGVVAMIAGAIVLWWRLRRRRNANRNSNLTSFQQPHMKPELDDTQMYVTRSEMEGLQRSVSTRQKRFTTRSLYVGQKFELDSRRGP